MALSFFLHIHLTNKCHYKIHMNTIILGQINILECDFSHILVAAKRL